MLRKKVRNDFEMGSNPKEEDKIKLVEKNPWNEVSTKDFLYGRKGPWPQPSPAHPFGESPAVIHLPLRERADWWAFIGSRYIATLLYTPVAYIKGILNPGLEPVPDKEFESMLQNSTLARFIHPNLDEQDLENFKSVMNENEKYFIVDLQAIRTVETFKDIYASATKTLLKEVSENKFEVKAIYIFKTDTVFTPHDGDAWELAKYFVLQGCAMGATLVSHPLLHFPYDSINAITKTALPKNHVLFKLLYPHFRFTLPLENAVLTFKSSLLASKAWMSYAPYPGPAEGIRDLLVQGYRGIKGNKQYPEFKYPLSPPKIYSTYGTFLSKYYDVFYKYCSKVLEHVDKDDYFVARWAKYCSDHLPGFPNEKEIFEGDTLIRTVAMYMWTVTVAHSTDHYDYGNMNIRKIPLRIRQQPPVKNIEMKKRSKLTSFWDYGKYEMARILFFKANEVTHLLTTQYDFDNPKLKNFAIEFIEDLKKVDSEVKEKGICYMPLEKIARSIQY